MRIQTKNKEIAWSAEKRESTERNKTKQNKTKKQKKNQFLALQLTTFNRPLLHLNSLRKCRFPKHLTCEEKGRVFFEHVMSIRHDVMRGMSHVPCTRVKMPWRCQQLRTQFEYKRT